MRSPDKLTTRRSRAVWPPPPSNGCEIKWEDGWIEQFDESEFVEDSSAKDRRVLIYKKGATPLVAEYRLTVWDTYAELDYGGKYEKVNAAKDRGWDIGRLRLSFADSSRTTVTKIEWANEYSAKFREIGNLCSWRKHKRGRFDPNALTRKRKAMGSRVLRPGQLRFRDSLRTAYGGRCSITNFGVWEALEAAHIKPFDGPNSDHIQNGVLLRADLHRLFDRDLIGINPETFEVVLAPSLRRAKSYHDLHGATLRVPRRAEHRPNKTALRQRWKQFLGRAT